LDIGKEAVTEISKGVSSLGSQIGLGATIAGLATAVSKSIASSSLPPIQKAAIVIVGGVAGGAIHTAASAMKNSYSTFSCNTDNKSEIIDEVLSKNLEDSINNFINTNSTDNSPIIDILSSINILSHVCFTLVIFLLVLILFKFFFNEKNILLNFSNFIGNTLNDKLNNYLIKYIRLYKITNNIYI
jgi:hypothetical protein